MITNQPQTTALWGSSLSDEAHNRLVSEQYGMLKQQRISAQLAIWQGRKLFIYSRESRTALGKLQQGIQRIWYAVLSSIVPISHDATSIEKLFVKPANPPALAKDKSLTQFLKVVKGISFQNTPLTDFHKRQFIGNIEYFEKNQREILTNTTDTSIYLQKRKSYQCCGQIQFCSFIINYQNGQWSLFIKPSARIPGIRIGIGGIKRVKKIYEISSSNPTALQPRCYKSTKVRDQTLSPFFDSVYHRLLGQPFIENFHLSYSKPRRTISDLYDGDLLNALTKYHLTNWQQIELALKLAKAVQGLHQIPATYTFSTGFKHTYTAYHGDISPSNFLVTYDPQTRTINPYLSDFDGICSPEWRITHKAKFEAPEYQNSHNHSTPTTDQLLAHLTNAYKYDIWGLGLTFVCILLKGEDYIQKRDYPFIKNRDGSLQAVLQQVQGAQAEWHDLLYNMLRHTSQNRWNIDQVIAKLETMLNHYKPASPVIQATRLQSLCSQLKIKMSKLWWSLPIWLRAIIVITVIALAILLIKETYLLL